MVPPVSDRISPVPPYSGYRLGITNVSHTGLSPSMIQLSSCVPLHLWSPQRLSYNPSLAVTILVWANSRSLATTWEIIIIFFSSAYLDVSVQRVRLPTSGITCLQHVGFPHSEISGLKVICTYPKLIAAYHVLLRLWEPRHPPYALNHFLRLNNDISLCLYCSYFKLILLNSLCLLSLCQRTFSMLLHISLQNQYFCKTVENKGVEPLTSRMQI